ncbi:LysR family transcriptional regulator [Actinoplanes philippinensis]|uniref:DNA-binding transcriptional regulator, LysR family n=1 Tax=Actinoplanes philippinensis TaxID=35752 RepID=A0A1I2KQP0_9ACTN|nr:LysR family transcriptional regulator [Actinoplanes philippinensis]GIE82080.1 LysR family transcriptional regulator [Actinoplanes philippinensis]SFF69314.1 DNA-binding transcriptional regulator, LysR family [Actinoplanes philippinensis]
MDVRRLETLLMLSRLGSMRAVADEMYTTTSTVSQQIAALSREAGTPLTEPEGRRVRLTPAGRRLAEHAVTILAALEAARLDLDPTAEPAGTLRVAGFGTAIRRSLMPVAACLAVDHPKVRIRIHEHEPIEALSLLASDDIDLALTYDFNLAPAPLDRSVTSRPLWSAPWSLGVPATDPPLDAPAPEVFARYRDAEWIANSRGSADEEVIRTIARMADFDPLVTHRADSLLLLQDLVVAGLGVGLLPADQPTRPGVRLLLLRDPRPVLRTYAVVRAGRTGWPPLALLLNLLQTAPPPPT